jgi:hypothetical protein
MKSSSDARNWNSTDLKSAGADTVQLEFNQTIYKDAKTGKWHVDD